MDKILNKVKNVCVITALVVLLCMIPNEIIQREVQIHIEEEKYD